VDIRRRDFPTVPSSRLFSEALKIAHTHDRSGYDCMHVALAVQSKTEWITADERLANAAGRALACQMAGCDLIACSPLPRFASSGWVAREFFF
jgi:predicted nucleic acid-binding protein